MRFIYSFRTAFFSSFLLCGISTHAQFSYPGCNDLKASDFKATEVINRNGGGGALATDNSIEEPVQMDLHGVKNGTTLDHVDIYFVQRGGGVKYFNAATKKISDMGKIEVLGQDDNGLMGIALDPKFDDNRFIYLWYSPNKKNGDNRILRLVRITVTVDNKLDMASEKIMIEILGSKSDRWHSGGPMTFDAYGDLWVTVGNNSPDLDPGSCNVMSKTDSTQSGEWGPSNTANLRGGIFRIHPDASAKGYSIPAGNFGDYWAKQWDAQGKTALAAEYRNTAKVLPEVYVKGDRSNFSISVHPTKRWLAWGVVNYQSVNDEFNLTTHPVFAGYPYFHDNNLTTCDTGTMDPAFPKNNSPLHTGVVDLPPATPGMINNLVNVAISGPIYAFDVSLDSKTKFPPHLNQSWMQMSFQSNQIHMSTLDTTAITVKKTQRIDNSLFTGAAIRSPLQAKYGPDGALYILNYDGFYSTINPGVTRIDYIGDCHLAVSNHKPQLENSNFNIEYRNQTLSIGESGLHEISLYDLAGNLVYKAEGKNAKNYSFLNIQKALHLKAGIYSLQVKVWERGSEANNASFHQKIFLMD